MYNSLHQLPDESVELLIGGEQDTELHTKKWLKWPYPRLAQLLLLSPAAVSIEFPRCAGTADIGPRYPELAGPSILLWEKSPEEKLGHTKLVWAQTQQTENTWPTREALSCGVNLLWHLKYRNLQVFSRCCQSRGIGAFLFFHSLSMVSKYMISSLKNWGGEGVSPLLPSGWFF